MNGFLQNIVDEISDGFLGPHLRIYPLYMVAFVAIGFIVYLLAPREGRKPFWSWIFPRDVYLHPSHFTDIGLFLVGRVFAGLTVLSGTLVPTFTATAVLIFLSDLTAQPTAHETPSTLDLVIITVVLTLANDFCVYWVHRIHHDMPVLWPFHSVHHSAEVLTPVTAYRKHPVYDLISNTFADAVRGVIQGFIVYFLVGEIEIMVLLGTNALYVLFNVTSANFRHSHIWISYGPLLEHIFISPAQHQIHHSRAVVHHDKNYGEVFAIWDWMFGTLYIPKEQEKLEFGLAEADGTPIPQPHGSVKDALIQPFIDSKKAYARARKKRSR